MKPKSNFIPSFLFVSWCKISHLWRVSAQKKKTLHFKAFQAFDLGVRDAQSKFKTHYYLLGEGEKCFQSSGLKCLNLALRGQGGKNIKREAQSLS